LVLTDDQRKIAGRILDFDREVLGKHVIDLSYKTKSNETLNDHGQLSGLSDGQNEHSFSDEWRDHLHRAQENVDEPSPLSSLGCLNKLKVSEDAQGLLHLTVDDHMQKKRANNPNSIGLGLGRLVPADSNINQEEDSHQNLDSKHNEALLKGKSLLEWGTALRHVGADGIVVHIR